MNKDNSLVEKPEETPSEDWAAWALIKDARKMIQAQDYNIVGIIPWIVNRLEAFDLSGYTPGKVSYVAVCTGGYWGRGATIVEAVKASQARRTEKVTITIVINDEKPTVDSWGVVCASSRATLRNIGRIGTVGSILNANKE